MKNIYLSIVFILTLLSSYSQIEKGTKSIGISFSSSQASNKSNSYVNGSYSNESNSNSIGASSNFNYFIKNNLSIGCALEYTYSKGYNLYTYPMGETNSSSSVGNNFSTSFNSSYYFQLSERFYFSITGSLIYGHSITNNTQIIETDAYSQETKTKEYSNLYSIRFNPSIMYFIRPKWGLKASFGSLYYTVQNGRNIDLPYDNHNNRYSYGLNLSSNSFSFGINYYFK